MRFRSHRSLVRLLAATAASVVLLAAHAASQAQTSFTYQGKLTDGGVAANGVFDFEFRLFDAAAGGSQIGSTVSAPDVPVADGVFSVVLDFGASAYSGSDRYLETAVRAGASSGSFTRLLPLQRLTAAPYAVRSLGAAFADVAASADALSAACTGCVGSAALANGSVGNAKITDVAGSKVTGTLPVAAIPSGSTAYIQNGTAQQSASYTITGTGTAGEFAYTKPQIAFHAVNEAAFTARDGTPVWKGFDVGGAFPSANTPWGLIAPINLPHGATITNVRYFYVDDSATALSMRIGVHSLEGVYSSLATHTSSVQSSAIQAVDVPTSHVVNNTTQSLELLVTTNVAWGDTSMRIRGAVLTYMMPRPAR